MAIRLTTSREASLNAGIKALVYGEAGTGKTTLCASAYAPLIISAEGGLLSIDKEDVPTIVINSYDECMEALAFCRSPAAKDYHTICLDSISEIAEVVLIKMKKENKDGRAAYGEMAVKMTELVRSFRDLHGKHVLFTSKLQSSEDETTKVIKHYPSMPGRTMTRDLPYFFDEVWVARIGMNQDGTPFHYLQTREDMYFIAKDRSRRLDPTEIPNMYNITVKMMGQ